MTQPQASPHGTWPAHTPHALSLSPPALAIAAHFFAALLAASAVPVRISGAPQAAAPPTAAPLSMLRRETARSASSSGATSTPLVGCTTTPGSQAKGSGSSRRWAILAACPEDLPSPRRARLRYATYRNLWGHGRSSSVIRSAASGSSIERQRISSVSLVLAVRVSRRRAEAAS